MEIKTDSNCIFCKIVAGEIPSRTVYEDERYKAIMDVSPASKGHVIILLKNHVPNVFELSDEDAAGIFVVARKMALALRKAFGCIGVNILQNNGEAAGQTVFHLHVHVVPRYENDTVNIRWTQKQDMDLDSIYEAVKNELQDVK